MLTGVVAMPESGESDETEEPEEAGEFEEAEEPERGAGEPDDDPWDPMRASGYWRITAIALTAVALLGLIVNAIGGNNAYTPDIELMESILVFDWAHDIVHVALAGIAIAFGFTALRTEDFSKPVAGTIGVVYLLLGVAGFIPGFVDLLDDLIMLHLEAGENILHLLLGAWGAYVGFLSDEPY